MLLEGKGNGEQWEVLGWCSEVVSLTSNEYYESLFFPARPYLKRYGLKFVVLCQFFYLWILYCVNF